MVEIGLEQPLEIRGPEGAVEPVVPVHLELEFGVFAVEMVEELVLHPLRDVDPAFDRGVFALAERRGLSEQGEVVADEARGAEVRRPAAHSAGDKRDPCEVGVLIGNMRRMDDPPPVGCLGVGFGDVVPHTRIVREAGEIPLTGPAVHDDGQVGIGERQDDGLDREASLRDREHVRLEEFRALADREVVVLGDARIDDIGDGDTRVVDQFLHGAGLDPACSFREEHGQASRAGWRALLRMIELPIDHIAEHAERVVARRAADVDPEGPAGELGPGETADRVLGPERIERCFGGVEIALFELVVGNEVGIQGVDVVPGEVLQAVGRKKGLGGTGLPSGDAGEETRECDSDRSREKQSWILAWTIRLTRLLRRLASA